MFHVIWLNKVDTYNVLCWKFVSGNSHTHYIFMTTCTLSYYWPYIIIYPANFITFLTCRMPSFKHIHMNRMETIIPENPK